MKYPLLTLLFICVSVQMKAQNASVADSLSANRSAIIQELLIKQQEEHRADSIIKAKLQLDLASAKLSAAKRVELEKKLKELTAKDSLKKAEQLIQIESLKKTSKSYPVVLFSDTLFQIYHKIGSFKAKDRAEAISHRIRKMYGDDFFNADSLKLVYGENGADIVYNNENIIMSISELDALWLNISVEKLANRNLNLIKSAIAKYREQNSFKNWMKRIGEIALIFFCLGLMIFLINKFFKRSKKFLIANQDKFLNGLTIKKFKIFTAQKYREFALRINNILRIIIIILFIYLSLPLIFSIFPETKSFTNTLLGWVLSPAKNVALSILHFLPNLFTIAVIYFITRWSVKGIKFFFTEIEVGIITLKGFHPDWAMPTFGILKFMLYAFMVVVIFPYLPGSDSPAFQGVSVFLGVLFSFGSSSAITNVIAGLVITYMRPFKIGDRVKIGEVVGDVMEKTMLVTRIRTIKNEDITVPNSTVLSSYTVNYSSNAQDTGLILHSTVTIGYDVPWKKMHQALIDAALKTNLIQKEPTPFVLQTSLDDFYVSYQINVYTKEPNKQAVIYSELHQHIQDCCNEAGIEILSPHYRASRDGNMTTIPEQYLSKDYKAPGFNVHVNK
ncbi:MAG TPA: mechanosensitive ion channel domain-containing protein [Bacteroidia bacterium]|nr:mechanosensitive ion channel domain-containing protein [Bacteroidia bacterium]